MAEPPIELTATSGLREATERIRDVVDAWFINWAEADTIIHPGRVTPRFLMEQAGKAPRSIISAQRGEGQTLGFGKQVNLNATFLWFLVLPGTIGDRTLDALTVVGKAYNLVLANAWMDKDDPACPFARSVEVATNEFQSLYSDNDEANGFSIWLIKWDQLVNNGPAKDTVAPLPEPLALITIDNRTEPPPDGETLVETQVD